jgi:hypothetical protein
MEQQSRLILFLPAPLTGKDTEDGKQKKAVGNMEIIDLMSDSKRIGTQKECNDSEDNDGNRETATYPGKCRKKSHKGLV